MNDENNDDDNDNNNNISSSFKTRYIIIIVIVVILLVIGIVFLVKHFKNKNDDTNIQKISDQPHHDSLVEESKQKISNQPSHTSLVEESKQKISDQPSHTSLVEESKQKHQMHSPPYYPNIDILQPPFGNLPYTINNQVLAGQFTEHQCSDACNKNPNCMWWAHNKNNNICALRGAINFPNVTTTFNDTAKHTFTFPNTFIAGNYLGNGIDGEIVPSDYICNQLCQKTPNCLWSSFNSALNKCWIQGPSVNTYGVSTGITSNFPK
jgi:hypothetical protein